MDGLISHFILFLLYSWFRKWFQFIISRSLNSTKNPMFERLKYVPISFKFAWKPAFKGLSKKNCFLLKGWNGLSWQDQTLYWTKQTFFFLSCTKRLSFIQDLVSTFFPHFCAKFKIAQIYVDCRIIHHSPVQATVSFAIHFFLKIFSREKWFEVWQNWLLFEVRVSNNAKSLT